MEPINFHGAKVALFHGDNILVYFRDEKDGIPFPGMWDCPGAGEGDETSVECALREIEEEFGIRINASQIFWMRKYPSSHVNGAATYFMAGLLTELDVRSINFGDEGQRWEFALPEAFVAYPDAV